MPYECAHCDHQFDEDHFKHLHREQLDGMAKPACSECGSMMIHIVEEAPTQVVTETTNVSPKNSVLGTIFEAGGPFQRR